MKKYGFFLATFTVLFISTVILTVLITRQMNDYKHKKEEIVEELNAESRLGNLWEWVPFLGVGDEKMEEYRRLDRQADEYYTAALDESLLLILIVSVFVIVNHLYYRKQEHVNQIRGLIMVFSALCFLYLGLQAPFLEIQAFKDDVTAAIPLENLGIDYTIESGITGRVYFLYHNKSVIETIDLLYSGGNYVVAIVILLFSVVFPIIKLLTSIIIFLSPHGKYAEQATNIVNILGKWSMVDVFLVAIFLAWFSFANFNVGVDTGSSTLIGTYFFLTFVVLSIASGSYLKKVVKLDPDSTEL